MTNVHNIFKGKLLKVDARAGDKGTMNIRLILASEKFDRGLEQMVHVRRQLNLMKIII